MRPMKLRAAHSLLLLLCFLFVILLEFRGYFEYINLEAQRIAIYIFAIKLRIYITISSYVLMFKYW